MSRKPVGSAPQPAPQFDKSTVKWRQETHREHGHQFMVPSSVDAVMPEFVAVLKLNDEQEYELLWGLATLASEELTPPGRQKSATAVRKAIKTVAAALTRIEGVMIDIHGLEVRRGIYREEIGEKRQKEVFRWLEQLPAMAKLTRVAEKQNHSALQYKSMAQASAISKSQAIADLAALYFKVTGKKARPLKDNAHIPRLGSAMWFVQKAAKVALFGDLKPSTIAELHKESGKAALTPLT
jgi:hypothetical protein